MEGAIDIKICSLPDKLKGEVGECGYQTFTGQAKGSSNIQNVSSKKHNGGVVGCERGPLFVGRIDLENDINICEIQIIPSGNGKELTVQTAVLYYHGPAYRSV